MKIGASTKMAAVLGYPVKHSKSPAMHNAAFQAAGIDAVYLALPVAEEGLVEAISGLKTIGAIGVNLTVPHKERALLHCDALSSAAKEIGAVNTLEFSQDGKVTGHNTDATGYSKSLQRVLGQDLSGQQVIVLGGGGAARAVVYGLRQAGVRSLEVIARRPEKVGWTKALSWQKETLSTHLPTCTLLVDCTSAGLSAETEVQLPCAIDLGLIQNSAIVSTLVYHRETRLLAQAKAYGHAVLDGREMLITQGAEAFECWTGISPSLEAMRAAAFPSPGEYLK